MATLILFSQSAIADVVVQQQPPKTQTDAKPESAAPADSRRNSGPIKPLKPVEAIKPKEAIEPPEPTDPLAAEVDKAIAITKRRILSADVHTPWQIAHGVLALRQDYLIKKDGKKIRALDWIASGPTFKGRPWFLVTEHGGKAHPFTQPYAFEGHPNQFLALFTLSDLPMDFEFRAGEKTITIADMIKNAKMEVNDIEEITWTLWTFAHYLEPDARWTNQHGEQWSMERLVRRQMQSPVTDSACGGTHGLFAVASACNSYVESGKSLRGTWLEAHMHVRRYIAAARSMQNSDGSFSADYFRGPAYSSDANKRISTTGHTLEFLIVALPQKRLAEEWVRKAVGAVARDLIEYRKTPLEPGGMYHALDSLMLYRERTRSQLAPDLQRLAKKPPLRKHARQ